jgi:hypothetical protein
MGSKGRCRCRSTVHRQALRYRCLTPPSPSQLNCVDSKLRNETLYRITRQELSESMMTGVTFQTTMGLEL